MMKKILYILLVPFFFSCDSENSSDCFKASGITTTKSYPLEIFSKVLIHEGIELEIIEGTENSIQIIYGKNLINEITTTISDDQLIIRNSFACNLIRDFEPAKIILTAINILEIRNASQFTVYSHEVLRFNSLTLLSENAEIDYVNVGDFNLKVENQNLKIVSNNVSNFKIEGSTNTLFVGFFAGQGKFEGEFLTAQNITIFHRGINEMIVNPIQQLMGEIRSSGNVIAISRPPLVDVEEFYTGKLIFRE